MPEQERITPETPVSREELAAMLVEFEPKNPDLSPISHYSLWAGRILERVADRRMTDPQRHALARLRNAARDIAHDVEDAVDEALEGLHVGEASRVEQRALLDLLERMDAEGVVDLVAGTSRVEEFLRRERQRVRA